MKQYSEKTKERQEAQAGRIIQARAVPNSAWVSQGGDAPSLKQAMEQRMARLRGREKSGEAPKQGSADIPNAMLKGFEALSGFSLDGVRVHYNSDKPAQMQAFAYAQGDHVYVAPGQEEHLGHEIGHVVQQKQDAVQATARLGGAAINDSEDLEQSADVMAAQAAQIGDAPSGGLINASAQGNGVIQLEPYVGALYENSRKAIGADKLLSHIFLGTDAEYGKPTEDAVGIHAYSSNDMRDWEQFRRERLASATALPQAQSSSQSTPPHKAKWPKDKSDPQSTPPRKAKWPKGKSDTQSAPPHMVLPQAQSSSQSAPVESPVPKITSLQEKIKVLTMSYKKAEAKTAPARRMKEELIAKQTAEDEAQIKEELAKRAANRQAARTKPTQTDSAPTDSTQTDSTQADSTQADSTQADSTQADSTQADSTLTSKESDEAELIELQKDAIDAENERRASKERAEALAEKAIETEFGCEIKDDIATFNGLEAELFAAQGKLRYLETKAKSREASANEAAYQKFSASLSLPEDVLVLGYCGDPKKAHLIVWQKIVVSSSSLSSASGKSSKSSKSSASSKSSISSICSSEVRLRGGELKVSSMFPANMTMSKVAERIDEERGMAHPTGSDITVNKAGDTLYPEVNTEGLDKRAAGLMQNPNTFKNPNVALELCSQYGKIIHDPLDEKKTISPEELAALQRKGMGEIAKKAWG